MPRKSNKTAHVLGLITNEKPAATADDEEASGQSPKPTRKAVVRKVASATMENQGVNASKLAEDIRGRLLDELDGPAPRPQETQEKKASYFPYEPKTVPPSITPESIPNDNVPIDSVANNSIPMNTENSNYEQAAPVKPTVKAVVADYPLEDFGASVPAAVEPAAVEPTSVEPVAMAPIATPTPSTAVAKAKIAEDPYVPPTHAPYIYINVLEELVKERSFAHMQTFGMCLCNRCVMDTIALALTGLPSKYVVVEKGEGIPLLNYYGTRFQIQVIAELTKACMTVQALPHH